MGRDRAGQDMTEQDRSEADRGSLTLRTIGARPAPGGGCRTLGVTTSPASTAGDSRVPERCYPSSCNVESQAEGTIPKPTSVMGARSTFCGFERDALLSFGEATWEWRTSRPPNHCPTPLVCEAHLTHPGSARNLFAVKHEGLRGSAKKPRGRTDIITYIYIYIYMCTHTCTYIYIYTHTHIY